MSGYQNYRVTLEDGVATICINRPETRNAMSPECWRELTNFIQRADSDPAVKVVILTGAGDKAFVSGADVNKLVERTGVITVTSSDSRVCLRSMEECAKPVIAALNGHAFGAGLEVALACDFRIAVESAKMGLPEAALGLVPGAGGTQRLTRIMGESLAKQMIMAGRVLSAGEALRYGILYGAVPAGELTQAAGKLARTLMGRAPLALQVSKRLIHHAADMDLTAGIAMENLGFAFLMDSGDKAEGVSAFLEKRSPAFQGE